MVVFVIVMAVCGLVVLCGGGWLAARLAAAVGFSSAGVVADSMAAAAQSVIGNVAAGSCFAATQSFMSRR